MVSNRCQEEVFLQETNCKIERGTIDVYNHKSWILITSVVVICDPEICYTANFIIKCECNIKDNQLFVEFVANKVGPTITTNVKVDFNKRRFL